MPKTIKVGVCPQCDGDTKPVPGGYVSQCVDCGWSGETTKLDSEGRKVKRDKVI